MADENAAQRVREQLSEAGLEVAIPIDVLKTRSAIAAHVYEAGEVTFIEARLAPPPPPRKICTAADLLDLAGYGVTGGDGSVRLHIRDFVCNPDGLLIEGEDEVWVVATPRSSEPIYLTHQVLRPADPPGPAPPPDPHDIQVRIFAWDSGGKPKANAHFTWRALLHVQTVIE
jgi:hypothetical protein